MQRRQFLAVVIAASLARESLGTQGEDQAQGQNKAQRPPRILLRSSWQTVNIGDIAHTPGVLRLLEQHLPEAELTLWPSKLDNGVDELLRREFPRVKFAQTRTEIDNAFAHCDFLLHGSGPSLVAERDVRRWHEETGKPFGVYGITLAPKNSASTTAVAEQAIQSTIDLLGQASFVFFRDSHSLGYARRLGCRCEVMEFAPDGAFACNLRDDAKATAFLSAHQLEEGKFLCCIPRLRYTPYWTIPSKNAVFDPIKHARNEEMKEHDHLPLRRAIETLVAETDFKVLVCPEDQTQMQVGKELVVDRLPASIRDRVVWRPDYWLTGEAVSTYVRSRGLFGNEMHSPIMCIGNGVPAIVCRFSEQTSKGYMWDDIGLDEWLFDLDIEHEVEQIPAAVLKMATNDETRTRLLQHAQTRVADRQRASMATLQGMLESLS